MSVSGEAQAQEQRDADNTQLATQFNRYGTGYRSELKQFGSGSKIYP